ncbi:MAG: glycosyltransferase family 4 protein [Woeseiaceae bacterium]
MNDQERPMRIAMFSRFPADVDQPKGGVEAATVSLARGLGSRPDIKLHVITLEKQRQRDSIETTEFADIHRLAGSRMPMMLDVFNGPGRKKINRYISGLRPDVVHFQETYGFGGPCPDVPTVFTVHGFDSLNLATERKYLWRLRAPLWRIAERKGIRSQKHLVSIAPYVTERLEKLASAEIVPIPNAISPEFFSVTNEPVSGRVLFAGWVNERKNLIAAIGAISKLVQQGADVSLHAAGAFVDESYAEKARRLIDQHRLQHRVKLLGRISQVELRRELSQASLFLLPSLQENAPMAIAESMAAGVPVVTSNVCGMRTMVEDGQTGFLIEPRNVGQIAEKVGTLLLDESLRTRMGRYARAYALQTYHPDAVVDKTASLYRRIANSGVRH